MKILKPTSQFKKDLKCTERRGLDLSVLYNFLKLLCNEQIIPPEYKAHFLHGNMEGYRECHLKPGWLLIWKEDKNNLYLTRTGSHSDL
ncbi:MAG: type II toxin-antitoxin system mRNA interferase toxin, RelE/StbE family [Candidatus Marinimicrobia bacterium CG08_land_8_20_14_0_20_45_22]|nr:MAG: type II toxin-antitoxin system mRNA interferase toxin, RelE/StbE family [Candidatus Marinimicrobia bacterium CG08_land_8_20_14_0_20_45_22]